jgi:hypothetical protein
MKEISTLPLSRNFKQDNFLCAAWKGCDTLVKSITIDINFFWKQRRKDVNTEILSMGRPRASYLTYFTDAENLLFKFANQTFGRFQGTRVDEAKVMIAAAGLKILPVDNLDEAAR